MGNDEAAFSSWPLSNFSNQSSTFLDAFLLMSETEILAPGPTKS
jgi:hypothetical protein